MSTHPEKKKKQIWKD